MANQIRFDGPIRIRHTEEFKQYKFELLVHWPNGEQTIVKKTFNAKRSSSAWGAANRWRNNCLAICGKNSIGQTYDLDSLSLDIE